MFALTEYSGSRLNVFLLSLFLFSSWSIILKEDGNTKFKQIPMLFQTQ